MDLRETYNKIAKDWMQDHAADIWSLEGTEKFSSLLPAGASVLDVGCGAGEKSIYLAEKGFKVMAIDFSEEMIRLAKERALHLDFSVKDITEPLELTETFDGVFAQAVLLHIPKAKIRAVLKNITTPLRQGGYFYMAVKAMREDGVEEEMRKEDDYGYEYERFFSYYSLPEVRAYMEELGFKIVYENVKLWGKTNWIQVIAKKP
jgi:cyclopropane fatty-acyl-phospholipid synthase-like methyltransferase